MKELSQPTLPILTVAAAFFLLAASQTSAADFSAAAREWKIELVQKVLPYWHDTAIDRENGGYILSDDAVKGRQPATEKQLVTQARMVWGFSLAHRRGYCDPSRNYLKAAETGYRFLIDHFLDREHGGYYWKTDLRGTVTNARKIVYGESFVIYAFVEYHRAGGGREPLQRAKELYDVLMDKAYDRSHGGWIEHFERNWQPILTPVQTLEVEIAGYKSANTHLHLMEALTELYDATRDRGVRRSLDEAVRINANWFYPYEAGKSAFHLHPDWAPVTDPGSAGLSYGHNVEFAWLMIRAQQVLGRTPSWSHFEAHLRHALTYGYDHERGGLYNRGAGDQPATDTSKVWWVQSEMLAALTYALEHRRDPAWSKALNSLLTFLRKYQVNPADGIWLDTVAADGTPKSTAKAHNWKANYHDVRAIDIFIRAFRK